MDLHDELKKSGWRQGSVLTDNDYATLLPRDSCQDCDPIAVVISHSCDLLNPKVDKFPKFEVAVAKILQSPDPNFQRRRNPRVLHLPITINTDERWIELKIENRNFLDRALLRDREPDKARRLLERDRHDMALWVGGSYYRSALPDDFQNCLRGQKKSLKKIYEEISPYVSDVLVSIYPDGDLGKLKTYSATLTIVVVKDEDVANGPVEHNCRRLEQVFESAQIQATVTALAESKATIKLLRSSYRMTEDFWSNLDNDEPLSTISQI